MLTIESDSGNILPILKKIQYNLHNRKNLAKKIAAILLESTESAFESESDPSTGIAWLPLQPSTIAQRSRKGRWPGPILQQTGQLAASITTAHGIDYAEIGSHKVYAATHQYGRSAIPARPFLGLDDVGREEIYDVLEKMFLL